MQCPPPTVHTSSGPSTQPGTAVPPASSNSSDGSGGFLWWPIVTAVTGVIAAAFAAFFVAAALRRRRRNRVAPDTSVAARQPPPGQPQRHTEAVRTAQTEGQESAGLYGAWDADLLAPATSVRAQDSRSGWVAADVPHAVPRHVATPDKLAWVAAVRPPESEQDPGPDAQLRKKKTKTKKPGVKATPILDFSPRVSFLGLQSPHLPNYVPTDGDLVETVEDDSRDPARAKQLTWAPSPTRRQSAKTSLAPPPPRSRLPPVATASPYAPSSRPKLFKRARGLQQGRAKPSADAAQDGGPQGLEDTE